MKTFNSTDIRKNLYNVFNSILKKHEIYRINYKKENIIMINENDYEELLETIELLSSPGFIKKLKKSEQEIKKGDVHSFEEIFN